LGLSIPEDISVLGYDGIESSRYSIQRLSTIRQDTDMLAKKGVEDILLRINYNHAVTDEFINFELIEGESVRNLKQKRKNAKKQ
jgi:LacI family transcriptional regulator